MPQHSKQPVLHANVYGDKRLPCLVFLHGFMGSNEDWEPIIAKLKPDFYCVSIDLPGHGNSHQAHLSLDNGFDETAILLERSLNRLQITRYSLIGYSLGGRLALHYCQYLLKTKSNHQIEKLILESANPFSEENPSARLATDTSWSEKIATMPLKDVLTQWYQQAIFNPLPEDIKTKLIINRIQQAQGKTASAWANTMLATSVAKQHDHSKWLSHQDNVIYFYGELDKKYAAIGLRLQKECKTATYQFKHSGHNVHIQNPSTYINLLKKVLPRSTDS